MTYVVRQNPASTSNYTSGRNGNSVVEIVLHHAATTDFNGIGTTFSNPDRGASAHYAVGVNQNVDQFVSEDDTAWHAGDWGHNLKSIGIEHVNLTGAPDWSIALSTIQTSIELCRDIASRHGILPLKPGVNFFGHKDVCDLATACPFALEGQLQAIADAVNGSATTAPAPAAGHADNVPDQILHIGEHFQFQKPYRVDNLAFVGGIWQIQTNELCPIGFTWDDNGIPADPVTEVSGGVGPVDQVLQVGSMYTIPGTFEVLNLGVYQGHYMAQIALGGYHLWVDIATVTEV